MADVFVRVKPPTIVYNSVTQDDPRSFTITRVVKQQTVAQRPFDVFDTTVEVFGEGYSWSFTIGDEPAANVITELTRANMTDKSLVVTTVASHGDSNIVYTLANSTITGFPALGGGFQEARTFTVSGVARSADGSTDPLTVA